MVEFRATPPNVQVADPQGALNTLWAFVEGIGLDPAAVLRAYANEDAASLGFNVGRVGACLQQHASAEAVALFK